jgi:hypothetical protein
VPARAWGFKSPLRHHLASTKVLVSVRFGRHSSSSNRALVIGLSSDGFRRASWSEALERLRESVEGPCSDPTSAIIVVSDEQPASVRR